LAPVAASFRIVPAMRLWKNLGRDGEPRHGWDVKDWLEAGGDPTRLIDICREIPAESQIKIFTKAEFLGGAIGLSPPTARVCEHVPTRVNAM
jgi:hypothetical protein